MPGRKPLYETVEELDSAIQSYFDEFGEDITIPGLAYHLGFESRQSIYDYKEKEEFSYSIKRATLKIEAVYAKSLKGQNVTGIIFALKNMGWKDKTESEITGANGGPLINIIQQSAANENEPIS